MSRRQANWPLRRATALLLAITWSAGCCTHDPQLHEGLASTKPLVTDLYGRFSQPEPVADEDLQAARASLEGLAVMAGGNRRPFCDEPARQVGLIRALFERHVRTRLDSGAWSAFHLEHRREAIGEAFDIAIQTQERLK